jgi:hypothetical protein
MKLKRLVEKTLEKNWETLMIRACKKNKYSPYVLRRIYAASRALSMEYTPIEYATNGLMEIIKKYDLVRDWHEFIIEIDQKRTAYWYRFLADYQTRTMPFNEAFLLQCACLIARTEVSKLPEYRAPAWFRNRYPEEERDLPLMSNCCGAYAEGAEDIGMCPDCHEHCEFERESA